MDPIDLRSKENTQLNEPSLPPQAKQPSGLKKVTSFFWEVFKIVVVSLVIIIPIRMYVVQPFIVEGASMLPNFHDGEYLIVDEISYRFTEPGRGDVVIFHPPQNPKDYYIKRIIGLPNETVEIKDGKINIYNEEHPDGIILNEVDYQIESHLSINETNEITLGANEYYLIGDNRTNSLDSRRFGAINIDFIKGRAWIRVLPFDRLTIFEDTIYNF